MSEELEGTLRATIESHFNERLRAINEEFSRLQEDFNSAFARLRESSADASLVETPLATSIAEHLQSARTLGESDAVAAASSATSGDVANLKVAIAEIEGQRSQVNVLTLLLTHAAQFAHRAALFVIKNEQAAGWRMRGAGDMISDDDLREIVLPLTADTLLSYVARSHSSWNGEPGSNSEDDLLLEELGGQPQRIAAVPLVVRSKTVAVLYADTESSDPNAINLDALETLTLVAAMAVELVSMSRGATKRASATEATQPAAQAPPAFAEAAESQQAPVVPGIEAPPSEVHEAAPALTLGFLPGSTAPFQRVEDEPEVESEPQVSAREAEPASVAMPVVTSAPMEPPPAPVISSGPSFGSQYVAPLGATRRYGAAEPELPIEVDEEERRFHTDARRFARLLVSEIKLYNEQKVNDGRVQSDIYDRLREDIDRSRQMYEKRIAPPVASRYDYFHQEIVNTLAEGDPSKLGVSYPGDSVPLH